MSPKLWVCSEDTAFVAQGSEQALPSLTTAERFTYLIMEGPEPLLCGAQHFLPVLPLTWGAESPFWHSRVEKHSCSKAPIRAFGACRGAGTFGHCPCSAQGTVLNLQLGQNLPTAYSDINQRNKQIQVPADLLCPLPAPGPPTAGRKVFFLPILKLTRRLGWHCLVWLPQVPHLV